MLSEKKKKGLHKNFSGDLQKKRSSQKNVFQKIFQALHKILTIQKIMLSSSQGQANFRGLEAKAKDFKMCPRGQGRPRGLHLCHLYRTVLVYPMGLILHACKACPVI